MKKYRLKENVKIRLQGIMLLLIACAAHVTKADGAAVFMACFGMLMVFPFGKVVDFIYHIAKAIVYEYEAEKE